MTVVGSELRISVRPRIAGSPPKRVCHVPYESTTTGAPLPGVASATVKVRPRIVFAPRMSNVSAPTKTPLRRSGVPVPVRFTLMPRMIPIDSKERERARHSITSE